MEAAAAFLAFRSKKLAILDYPYAWWRDVVPLAGVVVVSVAMLELVGDGKLESINASSAEARVGRVQRLHASKCCGRLRPTPPTRLMHDMTFGYPRPLRKSTISDQILHMRQSLVIYIVPVEVSESLVLLKSTPLFAI